MRSARSRRGQLSDISSTLNEKQETFIREYVAGGGQGGRAAKIAGYAEESADREAWRLLRNPLIQQRVYEETHRRFATHAPEMQSVVRELAISAKSPMVRLLAAQDWLDRAGFRPIEQHHHLLAGELKVSIDLGAEPSTSGPEALSPPLVGDRD